MNRTVPRILVFLFCVFGGMTTSAQTSPFAVTISLPRQMVKAGEDIPLYITYKNVSDQDGFLLSDLREIFPPSPAGSMPPSHWTAADAKAQEIRIAAESRKRALSAPQTAETTATIIVLHEDGTDVARTAYGRSVYDAPKIHTHCTLPCDMRIMVPAGSERMDSTLLNKLYDLSAPGTYTVQVKYTGERPAGNTAFGEGVKSNVVTITVTE